jgi:hypothetical protein
VTSGAAHVPLPTLALDVVAVPARLEKHDLPLPHGSVLVFPGPDVDGLDKRAHARLASFRKEPHVHDGRRSHQVLQRHPVAGLGAERSRQRQTGAFGRDEVGGGVEVGAAVLVYDEEVGLVGGRALGLSVGPSTSANQFQLWWAKVMCPGQVPGRRSETVTERSTIFEAESELGSKALSF